MKKYEFPIAICLSLTILFLLAARPLFAQKRLSKRLIKEREKFREAQITTENRLFLDQLSVVLAGFVDVNKNALGLLESFPLEGKISRKSIVNNIKHFAKRNINLLSGNKKSARNIKTFMANYFNYEQEFETSFRQLLAEYRKIRKIGDGSFDSYSKRLPITGSQYYYKISHDSLNAIPRAAPEKNLLYAAAIYKKFSYFAENHSLKELKELLPNSIDSFKTSHNLIQTRIIDLLELTNKSWGRNVLLKILNLIQKQIKLNENFFGLILYKLESIFTPLEPALPDFIVTSVETILPDKINVGVRITVVAVIQNAGQLTAGRSYAEITFPSGLKKRKAIPRLSGGQIYEIRWKYKLRRDGANTFTVIANHKNRAWEFDTANNKTKRTLVF